MRAHSQSLHSKTTQVVETTFGISSTSMPGMNFRQSRRVTKRGAGNEKTTRKLAEAFFISIFILCLFLTGCTGAMSGGSNAQPGSPILLVGGEATLPVPTEDPAQDAPAPKAAEQVDPDSQREAVLKTVIDDEKVRERLRLVFGWLKFVRQEKSLSLLNSSFDRVERGEIVGSLNFDPISEYPELEIGELMLWRQLVLTEKGAKTQLFNQQLEAFARTLALASKPDDLLQADRWLPEGYLP